MEQVDKTRRMKSLLLLLITLLFCLKKQCNGAFLSRAQAHHDSFCCWIPSSSCTRITSTATTLRAKRNDKKQPYRLGVYPYRNDKKEKQQKKLSQDESDSKKVTFEVMKFHPQDDEQQESSVKLDDKNATVTWIDTNLTLQDKQSTRQQQGFLLKQQKSFASNIIDSFLNATNETSHMIDSLWGSSIAGDKELMDTSRYAPATIYSSSATSGSVGDESTRNVTASHNNRTIMSTTTASPLSPSSGGKPTRATLKSKRKERPSVLLPSQPFFSTWTYDMRKPKQKKVASRDKNATTTTTLISKKNPTDVLTVADLEAILQDVRETEIATIERQRELSTSSKYTSLSKASKRKSGNIAFPQTSILSYKGLTIGSTAAAGFLGMVLGITIMPNLWLVGLLGGSLYGYDVSKDYQTKPTTNIVGRSIIYLGRRVAKLYLHIYDWCYGIFFLYKTGQLSYDYYKQYAKLDERFGLQEKMDAWNARFVKGKESFDAWEQNNEIGRRVIAGLRTAWLVEENRRKQTQYRVVQYAQDAYSWCRRFVIAIWDAITGGGSSNLREVLKGIRIDVSESRMQEIGPRIGGGIMAVVLVAMIGSLYAIAPRFLGLIAIGMGVIWPTWSLELYDRLQVLASEFAATGRGEQVEDAAEQGGMSKSRSGIPVSLSQQFGLYDKKRYWYYQREDGSRRWYRVGLPAFRSDDRGRSATKSRKSNVPKNNSIMKRSTSGTRRGASNRGRGATGNKPNWGWFS